MPKPNAPIPAGGRPTLAYHSEDFLDSPDGRPLRILSEYLHPLSVLRRRRVHDTIVFFGSARIHETGPMAAYYAAARDLARRVTTWAASLETSAHRYVICTGGGPGIMEAANRGASEAGGRTVGLNIALPNEQAPNPWITPGLGFEFHYFFMRKLWFAHLARAIVAFPGGFGTLDELFEMLTLSQTGKLDRRPLVLLYGREYWSEIVNFPALARHGMIAEEDLSLFRVVDTPDEAFGFLSGQLAEPMVGDTPAIARSATPVTPAGQ